MNKNLNYLTIIIFTIITALTVCGTSSTAWAQSDLDKQITINSTDSFYNVTPAITVIEDTNQNKSFSQILKEYSAGEGYAVKHGTIFIPHSSSGYWMIFKIRNNNPLKEKWMLHLGRSSDYTTGIADHVEFFSSTAANTPLMIDGRLIKNKRHILGQQKNTLPIKIKSHTADTLALYIKPTPGLPLIISPQLEDINYFESLRQENGLKDNVLTGLGIIIIFALLAILYKSQNTIPLTLAVYTALHIIIYKNSDEIISLGNNTSAVYIDIITALAGVTALTLMYQILNAYKNPYSEKLARIGIFFIVSIVLLTLIGYSGADANKVVTYINLRFIPLLSSAFILASTVLVIIKKELPQNNLYLASWIIVLLGLLMREANIFTAAQISSIDLDFYWTAFTLHLLLLIFSSLNFTAKINAYRKRLKQEQEMKEKAELELNKTREIVSQNQLLSVMQREKDLIMDLKKREAERMLAISEAKEMADKANKAKTDFLAVISHEIRTPMTGIMGIINLLKDTPLNKKQFEYIETLHQTGNILLMLLNDILDFSKAEAGRMDIEEINFNIHDLIKNVTAMMTGPAKDKHINLEANISSDVPKFLKGDPARIRQILTNLISNAVKFTDKGTVKLDIKLHKNTDDGHEIFFSVKDNGIGIPEEVQQNLFKPYAQATSSISRKFGGTGLGLSICHRLIEAMGGDIELKSKVGQGTLFYFTLPLKKGKAEKQKPSPSPSPSISFYNKPKDPAKNDNGTSEKEDISQPDNAAQAAAGGTGIKILVVDDNALNQKVIGALLEKDHHDITTVGTVIDAMNQIDKHSFNIIFMDMEMPDINGLTATRMIRSIKNQKKSKTPIIAMTANTDEESLSKCIQAGMNDHIAKPIDLEQVRKIILHFMSRDEELRKLLGSALPEPDPELGKVQKIAELKDLSLDVAQEILNKKTFDALKNNMSEQQLKNMINDLYDSVTTLIADAQKALDNAKISDIALYAHNLCGLSANFGLDALSDVAKQLERQAKNNSELEVLGRALGRLEPIYEDSKKAISKELATLAAGKKR